MKRVAALFLILGATAPLELEAQTEVGKIALGIFAHSVKSACADKLKYAAEWEREKALDLPRLMDRPADVQRLSTFLDDSIAAWKARGGCASYGPGSLDSLNVRKDSIRKALAARAAVQKFADVPWFASEAEAVQVWGRPAARTRDDESQSVALQYADRTVLSRKTMMIVYFTDHRGFVSGQYVIENERRSDCERVFDEAVRTVDQLYPTLKKLGVEKKNTSASMGLCDALLIDRGLMRANWRDTSSASTITVGAVDPSRILVAYTTVEGSDLSKKIAWLKNRRAF